MHFLLVKVPSSNEYTYEQSLAFLSSLVGGKSKRSFIPFGRKTSESTRYSLNIISIQQNIYFIVGSPEKEIGHVKNQLLAQFGKADIMDMDGFDDIGQINYDALQISEIKLDKKQYYPIQTMGGDQAVDPLSSILSTISRSPDPNAVFWVQIIITPADSSWQSAAMKRINSIAAAKITSQSMQNESAAYTEKIKYAGFKTEIRLAADTGANLVSLFNAFTVYKNPAGNKFSIKSPGLFRKGRIHGALANHVSTGGGYILNNLELASIWHMPNGEMNIPNIAWGKRLQLDPPEDLPITHENMTDEEKKNLTFLGKTIYKNREHVFGIRSEDRLRHVYIVGKTGSGKSWFIDNMAIEDIRKGHGVAVLDPHGDAIDIIMQYIPKNRIKDVCYFNPADPDYAYPLNILETDNENQRELMVSGIIAIFHKLYAHSWGPRLEHILRNVLFTLIHYEGATLPDIMKIFHNKKYRDQVLESVDDPTIHDFWNKEFANMSERFMNEAISPILNKVGQFVTSPVIRKIISHPKSTIKIDELMDNRKIFLCDLSQGKLGEDNATLLGSMIITKVQIAAMNRAFQSEEDRVPFYMYVDEFQNFATSSFTKILSEARKYKLGLTLANQYITQIDDDIMAAILGNVGTITCFNVGAKDSEILYKEFGGSVEAEDLTTLETYQLIMRMMIGKVMSQPFTFYALPLPKNSSGHRDKIIEASRQAYGVKYTPEKLQQNPITQRRLAQEQLQQQGGAQQPQSQQQNQQQQKPQPNQQGRGQQKPKPPQQKNKPQNSQPQQQQNANQQTKEKPKPQNHGQQPKKQGQQQQQQQNKAGNQNQNQQRHQQTKQPKQNQNTNSAQQQNTQTISQPAGQPQITHQKQNESFTSTMSSDYNTSGNGEKN